MKGKVICPTSSMTCCPLGSLLIRDWMTWKSGLGSDAGGSSTLQNKTHAFCTNSTQKMWMKSLLDWIFKHVLESMFLQMCLMMSSYRDGACVSPLRRFMTSVPRIMARLVRPTPTWQLKSRAGSGRDASWPRDKLGLSWRTRWEREQLSASTKSWVWWLYLDWHVAIISYSSFAGQRR